MGIRANKYILPAQILKWNLLYYLFALLHIRVQLNFANLLIYANPARLLFHVFRTIYIYITYYLKQNRSIFSYIIEKSGYRFYFVFMNNIVS